MGHTQRALVCAVMLVILLLSVGIAGVDERRHDVVVVGAGVSGLAAAWELAYRDIDVAVIEISSDYGGTGIISEGRICIIGTPEQAEAGLPDSPQIAFEDFMAYGRDEGNAGPHAGWVHYYVTNSRLEIYDWLTGLGVRFDQDVLLMPGNHVPRWHQVVGKGRGLIEPIYRDCVESGKVTFLWSTRAATLLRDGDRVKGVRVERLVDRAHIDCLAPVVILATGGFQSNMDMVRENWPADLPFPERLLIGSGPNSVGSGHEMACAVGAQLKHMSNQWNYATGLPDPRNPTGRRGLNAFSTQSIWVNREGRRFVSESQETKTTFPAVLRQPGSTYWAIFDSAARGTFFVSGWEREKTETLVFNNPAAGLLVKSAPTIRELAVAAGLPPSAVEETVRRWNDMITAGCDADFGRIGTSHSPWSHPSAIEKPPFYAVQFFPVTRKSMGGVAIDMSCRVIDSAGRPIPGLYAVGELTGLAGINGKAALEGTFLGPSIITGRVAGRAAAEEIKARKNN